MPRPTQPLPAIAALSPAKRALLERRLAARAGAAADDSIRPRADRGAAPLSFAQERLWVLDRLAPGLATYNVPRVLRLRGALDVPALRAALDALVERHEPLRTRFAVLDGRAVQVVRPAAAVALEIVDLDDRADREPEALRLATEAARRPFDLAADLLLRAQLLQLAEDDHVLVLVTHHIVSDEGSKAILFRDLAALYEAFRAGRPSPLEPAQLQYADYAAWQRRGGVADADWWRARLEGAPPALELPADRPRPPVQTGAGARYRAPLDPTLASAVRELARAERATPFMVLLAAFAALVSRLTGEEDVVIGTPVSTRDRPELQELIGCFVNTLALRLDASADASFRELVARARAAAVEAFEHRDVPFERVVQALQPQRDASRTPLFQVMLNVFDAAPGDTAADLAGLDVEQIEVDPAVSKFDAALVVMDGGDSMTFEWEYSSDLFDAETIEPTHAMLDRVLQAAVADPGMRIAELPLLSEPDRRWLVEELNDTAAPFPDDACLHELLLASAARRADATAVTSTGRSLSYRELDERSARLAARLTELGAGRGTLVGVCLERSVDLPVALLAVLRCGAAYVPLDPTYPQERLRLMLEDAGVPLVLTQSSLAARVPETAARVTLLEDLVSGDGPPAAPVTSDPHDLAYVIYTSGSTGRPKGVMLEHRSVVNFLTSMAREPGLGEDDILLALTTLSFDIAVLELYLPLLTGARVEIATAEEASDPELLMRAIERSHATVMQATPATWRMLVDAGWPGRPGLRILCGGEALPAALADELIHRGGELWNLYGPTETTVWSAARRVERPDEAPLIGPPIANTQLHVLDPREQLVPPGVTGELYIGGDGLARGYLGRPDLTAERFVPDPFTPGGRLYRTGDCVRRRRRDGAIEFLGRLDNQVKLRGFRIELGEVEAALAREQSVAAAVAVVYEHVSGDRRLVAYVQPRNGACDPAALRESLQASLPDYMVPSTIVALDALPLTPNGKVDRKALPAPNGTAAPTGTAIPRSRLERRLAAIVAEVLGHERVGVDDDFFAIGGDSLSAMRLMTRINSELGVRLRMTAVVERPTVAGLAELAASAPAASGEAGPPPPVRLPRTARAAARTALTDGARLDVLIEGRGNAERWGPDELAVFPVSAEQQRVWFFELLEPGNPLYHMPLCVRVDGALDTGALRRALDELVARHEPLRTTFAEHDGRLVQAVARTGGASLAVLDASERPDPLAHALKLARVEARRPFDLATGPLLRGVAIRLGDREHVLCLTLHHMVGDARSLELLTDELGALYDAFASGRPAPPPASAERIEYGDYACWQRDQLDTRWARDQLEYWRRRLIGAPRLELPTDRERSPVMMHEGARHTVSLDPALVEKLQATARSAGATLFAVLAAALDAALSAWTGQQDISVGTPVLGRTRPELDEVIGYLANTVVLRTDLAGDPTFTELVRRERDTIVGAFDNQEVPFDAVVQELRPDRDLSRSPLFDVLLILQGERALAPRIGELPVSPVGIDRGIARFDLTVSFAPQDDAMRVAFEYSTALFDAATIERFGQLLSTVLERAAGDGDARLSQLTAQSSDIASRIETLPAEKRELLARLMARKRRESKNGAIPLRSGDGPWPLSFPQARLWFLEQLAPGLPTYNAALAMRVRGPLDVERLRRSIEAVIERHEALRTTFPAEDGWPRQQVLEDWAFELPERDLRELAPQQREAEMLRLVREEARRPFDLTSDLMLRALVCRLGDEDRALVFVEHHIAFDGWSDAALFAELEELYGASGNGHAPRLPELPLQYIDFAIWQNETMAGEVLESHRSFWRSELEGAPPHIDLPTDLERPPVQSFEGAHRHFTLPDSLADRVRELSRAERATPYMALLAAFDVLLHRWAGTRDVLVGTPIGNRARVELEPLIGFFSNTLVIRTRLDGDLSYRDVIARVKAAALDAFEHQDLPFEKVVEAVRPPRDPSRNPIFQVNFRVQSAEPPRLSLPGLEIEPFDLDLGFARFDLALELQLHPGRFSGYLEYNLALFEPHTAERLVHAFEALLADAVERPDAPISSLDFPGF